MTPSGLRQLAAGETLILHSSSRGSSCPYSQQQSSSPCPSQGSFSFAGGGLWWAEPPSNGSNWYGAPAFMLSHLWVSDEPLLDHHRRIRRSRAFSACDERRQGSEAARALHFFVCLDLHNGNMHGRSLFPRALPITETVHPSQFIPRPNPALRCCPDSNPLASCPE